MSVPLSKLALDAKIKDLECIKLKREDQEHLCCVVNEDVFLECPYAFVSREELLKISQGSDSGIDHLANRIFSYGFTDMLFGYASNKIEPDEPGDFMICLTEEASQALISLNRSVTKNLRKKVQGEIEKQPYTWQEKGTAEELENIFLRESRPLYEVELSLPVAELRRPRDLSNRSPDSVRDGYIKLLPYFEYFENVNFSCISKSCQTNLDCADGEAQTYPGNPKNQWTQYDFEIPEEFVNIWKEQENQEEEVQNEEEEGSDKESTSEVEEEKEKTEEEVQFEEKRQNEWEKLRNFLNNCVDEMVDAVSFNASTNLYSNDVADLDKDVRTPIFAKTYIDLNEKVSLIDLKIVQDRYLVSASWHCELDHVLVCAYLAKDTDDCSLIALWSLLDPIRPKIIIKCDEQISYISFCPIKSYKDIIIGGCLDGKMIVWEISRNWFAEKICKEYNSTCEEDQKGPLIKEAKIATSGEKVQNLSISSIQWLPSWCRIESDGNFHKISLDSPKEQKAYFVTGSMDGSIFFWSLPRSLATPARVRSPLCLTISPIYQLKFEEPGDKPNVKIPITSFCFPLAKNEESSTLSIRDQNDLERLRKVFIGTATGEIMCCSWEGQTFSIDVSDQEVCKILTRCCVHDGIVNTITKSPHLDDVLLIIGGRVFSIWKEDFPKAPIFQKRLSNSNFGGGCWSGRSGMFILTKLDGSFELWDLKRKSDEPVLIQTVSGKAASCIYPSPISYREKLLAIMDGASTLRIFIEPSESIKDEDLERIEWFEEFAWRETKRKLDFHRWQDEYLSEDPMALKRKVEREQMEANRKHQEARERFLRLFGIICMACGSPGWGAGHWFLFVAVTAFIMSLLWSIAYLFSLREALKIPINWILTELLNTGIYSILYLTAFVAELASAYAPRYIAAGVFGLLNTLAYAAGTYFLYIEYKNGQA